MSIHKSNQNLVISLLLFFVSLQAHAGFLEFRPGNQAVELGDQANVDVFFSDTNGELVGAYGLSAHYDQSIVSLAAVDFGTAFGGPFGSFEGATIDNSNGRVDLSGFSFSDLNLLQGGLDEILIASLTFDTLSFGTTDLTMTPNILGSPGAYLGDEFGAPIPLDANSVLPGSITVIAMQAVFEPASAYVYLAVLGALPWLRRRASQLRR